MRYLLLFILTFTLVGCATTPYKKLNLDTTSNFNSPATGKVGVYVYQWKTGILGAGSDVNFEIKGQKKIPLNTGEFGYLELPPGDYQYKIIGGFSPTFVPINLEENKNYFFRAFLLSFRDHAILVRDQQEIEDAKNNILNGRYEPYDID